MACCGACGSVGDRPSRAPRRTPDRSRAPVGVPRLRLKSDSRGERPMTQAPMTQAMAQQLAQIFSLAIYLIASVWYLAPWTKMKARADALIPLLWVQAFRYVALQTFSAQQAGFPISDARRDHLVYGDVFGAALAIAAIVALRYRARLSVPLVWLVVAETVYDIASNISGGIHDRLFGIASGTTWFLQSFYIPLVVVTLGLIVWQLIARRGEPLARPA